MPSRKTVTIYLKDFYKPYFHKLEDMKDIDISMAALISRAVKAYVDTPDLPRLRHYLKEHPDQIERWQIMLTELKLEKIPL